MDSERILESKNVNWKGYFVNGLWEKYQNRQNKNHNQMTSEQIQCK